MATLPSPAIPAAPLTQAIEESDFQRLLSRSYSGPSSDLEKLIERRPVNSRGIDAHEEFLKLLERDYNPRGAAPTKIIERFKGLKPSKLDMAGLIAALGIIYVTELAKANRELGNNPDWVNWVLDATDFVSDLLTKAERQKAERESCDCCDKIAALAVAEINRVRGSVQKAALATDDGAKRYARNQASRANA